jgi:hypothetical protein
MFFEDVDNALLVIEALTREGYAFTVEHDEDGGVHVEIIEEEEDLEGAFEADE